MKIIPAFLLVLVATTALAQQPAVDTSGPAVDTSRQFPAGAQPAAPAAGSSGTTIVGERESPIGLYIMPWRNSGPEQGIDRPARLLDEEPLPLDPGTFRRQLDYYSALTAHRQSQQNTQPQSPAP
jgi:hypothetical protein